MLKYVFVLLLITSTVQAKEISKKSGNLVVSTQVDTNVWIGDQSKEDNFHVLVDEGIDVVINTRTATEMKLLG